MSQARDADGGSASGHVASMLPLSLCCPSPSEEPPRDRPEEEAMEDGEPAAIMVNGGDEGDDGSVVNIYPLSGYYFGSREAVPERNETILERVNRMKENYARHGLRTCVEGVLLVELFRHPHVLLLQIRNSYFRLPGGCLRPNESEIDGLKRKLSSKLGAIGNHNYADWQIGECLGMWWRSDFDTLQYPYLPPNARKAKECTKLFLVRLPRNQQFIVPKNLKFLAVPLCQIHGNHKSYGPVISGIPQLLSKFALNMIGD